MLVVLTDDKRLTPPTDPYATLADNLRTVGGHREDIVIACRISSATGLREAMTSKVTKPGTCQWGSPARMGTRRCTRRTAGRQHRQGNRRGIPLDLT